LHYCEETQQLYSTSKDNYINIYKFEEYNPETNQITKDIFYISKVSSIKEEDLNIIYQICTHQAGNKMVMLGFHGNYAYVWNKHENMQIMSIDSKGGNRPIRLRL
jgi:hypothetical protein